LCLPISFVYRGLHYRAYDANPTRHSEGVIMLLRAGFRVPPSCTGIATYGVATCSHWTAASTIHLCRC
jgi:hypothetical protein